MRAQLQQGPNGTAVLAEEGGVPGQVDEEEHAAQESDASFNENAPSDESEEESSSGEEEGEEGEEEEEEEEEQEGGENERKQGRPGRNIKLRAKGKQGVAVVDTGIPFTFGKIATLEQVRGLLAKYSPVRNTGK